MQKWRESANFSKASHWTVKLTLNVILGIFMIGMQKDIQSELSTYTINWSFKKELWGLKISDVFPMVSKTNWKNEKY